jgi:hypothetical protein
MPKQTPVSSHAKRKLDGLFKAWLIYLTHPDGVRDDEMAEMLDKDYSTVTRWRMELGAIQIRGINAQGQDVRSGRWTVAPTEQDVELARAILEAHERPKNNLE